LSKPKNILVITYWGYKSSILQSYALPYIRLIRKNLDAGGKIYLFTLTPKTECKGKMLQETRERYKQEGIELVNFGYSPFGLGMALRFFYILLVLLALTFRRRISYIHAWCTPGGAIGYIISVLTGKPLILDSFEPHAQSMVETGTWRKSSAAFRILHRLEKLQLKRSGPVICAAEGMIAYSQLEYGITKKQYYVKPACVDLQLFSRHEKNFSLVPGIDAQSLVCVYVGKFGDIYLSQEVFDFFKVASGYWGSRFKVLLLTNHSDEEVNSFCNTAGLDRSVLIKRFVDHSEVPAYLSLGHFGICPVRPVPTKQFCTPIKNAEYWAMGLPVVITKNISTDSRLITSHHIGYELQALNNQEYLKAVKEIELLLKDELLAERIRAIAEQYRNYSIADKIYTEIYG